MDGRCSTHFFQYQILHLSKLPSVKVRRLDMQQTHVREHDEAAVEMQASVQIDQQPC